MTRYIKWAALFSVTFLLFACTQNGYYPFLYKPDMQQGNVFDQGMLDQLKVGMSADQVRYIMGSPMLTNTLDANHWEYVYYLQPGKGTPQRKQVRLEFANGVLQHIGG